MKNVINFLLRKSRKADDGKSSISVRITYLSNRIELATGNYSSMILGAGLSARTPFPFRHDFGTKSTVPTLWRFNSDIPGKGLERFAPCPIELVANIAFNFIQMTCQIPYCSKISTDF